MSAPATKDGLHTVTPYLIVKGAAQLIEFLRFVLGAEELRRTTAADGTLQHARVRIGDSTVMLADATGTQAPATGVLYVYVENVDRAYARALQRGGTLLREPALQYYGDRNAGVLDPFGNQWWFAEPVESLSPEEAQRRAGELGI